MRAAPSLRSILAPGLVAAVFAACGEEVPTGVGGPLAPSGVQTFEILLDSPAFLESDTVLSGLTRPAEVGFILMGRDVGGSLNAHTIARFGAPPLSLTYTDSAGVSATDTVPRFVGAEVTFLVDTAATRATTPIELQMFLLGEAFDARSATWEFRVDTTDVREPWAVPGGTPVGEPAVGVLEPPADTVVIPLDSAYVARLLELDDSLRSAVFMTATQGARVRAFGLELRLLARPEANPDTLITATLQVVARTFLADPPPPAPAAGEMRFGGLPVWRTVLSFRDRLDTVRVSACPGVHDPPAACMVPLSSLKVNRAALQLSPIAAAPGYVPEDTIYLDARAVVTSPDVPLSRSPLGSRLNRRQAAVAPDRFAAPDPDRRFEVPLTDLFAELFRSPEDAPEGAPTRRVVTLLGAPEGGTFGYGAFSGTTTGALAPRLRLTVTSDRGIQ